MKRIVIDVSDKQHAEAKRRAFREGQTVANLFRAFMRWPMEAQGMRRDLEPGRRQKAQGNGK